MNDLSVIIQIDWGLVLSNLSHMAVAYVLALPIGLDRQASSRHFGLRTFPLVAAVSCGFMLFLPGRFKKSVDSLQDSDEKEEES